MLVEVVCCSVEDCIAAQDAGAGRIELCAAIELGGLTPSLSLLVHAKRYVQIPIIAMVRPRAGGFRYSKQEAAVMVDDIHGFVDAGADGVVFGALTDDNDLDLSFCERFISAAKGRRTTFHRAFDSVRDADAALSSLLELGVDSVLISGHSASALQGVSHLKRYRGLAAGRLQIVAGGGIRPANVREVVERSGCDQVHCGPFRVVEESGYGGHSKLALDAGIVRELVAALRC